MDWDMAAVLAARDEKAEAPSWRLVRPLDVDLVGGFVVALTYHPYLFAGRVETALRGGLCLCWGVAIDQLRQNGRRQSLQPRLKDMLPRPGETTCADWLNLPFPPLR